MENFRSVSCVRWLGLLAVVVTGPAAVDLAVPRTVQASFLFEVKILSREEIARLTDKLLIDTFIDVEVELEANRTFHENSGFNPREFAQYKDLIRYRIYLLMEFEKRGLRPPPGSAPPGNYEFPREAAAGPAAAPEKSSGLLQSLPQQKGPVNAGE